LEHQIGVQAHDRKDDTQDNADRHCDHCKNDRVPDAVKDLWVEEILRNDGPAEVFVLEYRKQCHPGDEADDAGEDP
jgi:hypothetical protein